MRNDDPSLPRVSMVAAPTAHQERNPDTADSAPHTHRPQSQDRSKKYSLGKSLSTWADQTIFANVLYVIHIL